MNNIGERIAQLRKKNGFTHKWETGTTMPDILLLPREERAEKTYFVYPGAIQYFGPSEVCDATTVTLALEKGE